MAGQCENLLAGSGSVMNMALISIASLEMVTSYKLFSRRPQFCLVIQLVH